MMKRILVALAVCLLGTLSLEGGDVSASESGVEAVVLGIAQDGGVPHLGCRQDLCLRARRDPSLRRRVASLGLIDRAAGKRFLIDATPDFVEQVDRLGGMPDAILLTHAHIGHYLGLAQLGREVANTRRLPVYCTPSMARFLRSNAPWSRLVERENIAVREIAPGAQVTLTERLRATAIRVPHRDEDSDTVAWLITGPIRRLLWLPDIDKWDRWDRDPEEFLDDPRLLAFVDGTFSDAGEIPGRSMADIPHPLVFETAARLSNPKFRGRVFFIHLNHTNRLLWDDASRSDLSGRGFSVAVEGSRHPI